MAKNITAKKNNGKRSYLYKSFSSHNRTTKEILQSKTKEKSKKKKIMAKLTIKQKYNSLKRQTENAGMKVYEKKGRLIVARKKK